MSGNAASTYCEECGVVSGEVHLENCSQHPEIEGTGHPAARGER